MEKIDLSQKTILVTGAAGFIGSNLVKELYNRFSDIKVIGFDSVNDYYDVNLKEYRLIELKNFKNFTFIKGNIADKTLVEKVFEEYKPEIVVNLAAQAGVRYSIANPDAYLESNLIGFFNILEACRHNKVEHLVYASSSSVYGMNKKIPYSTEDKVDNPVSLYAATKKSNELMAHAYSKLVYASSSSVYGMNKKIPYSTEDKVDNPVSLYAATKKSNELMAHAYSKLYDIPSTGLRFFTVYGPAGRPDMAYFGFTNKLIKGEKIQIFNYGNCKRDFTYIDDIVTGVVNVMEKTPDKYLTMEIVNVTLHI